MGYIALKIRPKITPIPSLLPHHAGQQIHRVGFYPRNRSTNITVSLTTPLTLTTQYHLPNQSKYPPTKARIKANSTPTAILTIFPPWAFGPAPVDVWVAAGCEVDSVVFDEAVDGRSLSRSEMIMVSLSLWRASIVLSRGLSQRFEWVPGW